MTQFDLRAAPDQFCKQQIRVSNVEYWYALYMESKILDAEHAFNMASGQKKFFRSTPDLYSPSRGMIGYLHGCAHHGHMLSITQPDGTTRLQACPYLPVGTTLDSTSVYGESFRSIHKREKILHAKILAETEIKEIQIVWQCEFESWMKDPETDVYAFFQSRQQRLGKQLPPPLKLRSALRGGNTELFSMQASATEDFSIQYYDINSL